MNIKINKINKVIKSDSNVILLTDIKHLKQDLLNTKEINYVKLQYEKNEKKVIGINQLDKWIYVVVIQKENETYKTYENCRKYGNELANHLNAQKIKKITVQEINANKEEIIALVEGIALSNYQFIHYQSDKEKKKHTLQSVEIFSDKVETKSLNELNILIDSIHKCRDLVNEPVCVLNAVQLANEIEKMFKNTGAKVEVMNKKKIETLKMGGLLAVNKGSIDPPTFTVIEWKPKNAINKKPYVLVGKGVVFDTGGINVKPGAYMETMKHDMSGAAAVACALYAVVKNNLPVNVVGLIPATDNRPDGNSYVPDDIITMYTGATVEIKNTDAEGRMILADALGYAKKYNPQTVIDIATLTGAAARAIGKYASVAMQAKADDELKALQQSGLNVFERIVEFPLWDDYKELIKSDVADIKNSGGSDAGAITAGKFLEHFTDYPYIHLDIAGTAFTEKKDNYRGLGSTGVGVRLFYDFLKNKSLASRK